MSYEIISTTDSITGVEQRHIILSHANGSFESFPVDEENSRYQAWVAEGNEPEVIDG